MEKDKHEFFDVPSNKALTLFDICKNQNKVSLVNNCEILAEKVEPGYLVKLAEEIEKANSSIYHNASGKLQLIKEQMKYLQQQAFQILLETKVNSKLHALPCNFVKKPNQVYSVYEKLTGEYYLSMLTPEEWGNSCPHKYVGSFKLEDNMMWTPIDDFSSDSAYRRWISTEDKSTAD